jgi:hypothetical protein
VLLLGFFMACCFSVLLLLGFVVAGAAAVCEVSPLTPWWQRRARPERPPRPAVSRCWPPSSSFYTKEKDCILCDEFYVMKKLGPAQPAHCFYVM